MHAEATSVRRSRIYGALALFAVLVGVYAVWLRVDAERQHVAAKSERTSMMVAARALVFALYEQGAVHESELTEAWLTKIVAERLASDQWSVQIVRDWQEAVRSEACDSNAPFLIITRVSDEDDRNVVAVTCTGEHVDGEAVDVDGFEGFLLNID